MSDSNAKLPTKAKGERPYFFDNPDVDKLLAMVMGLAGEVSVMRDRMDTLERLAAERGLFDAADIDAYEPSDQVLAERAARRQVFLNEITRIVSSEVEGLGASATAAPAYQTAIDLVENDG